MVALPVSSVAYVTPASWPHPSSAHQGQREVLRAQLNPNRIYLHFIPISFHPFSFPQESLTEKLPKELTEEISVGSGLVLLHVVLVLSWGERDNSPGPIKVNGNQWIQASLDLAGRACSRALAKPCPISIQLNRSRAKLLRSWRVLLAWRSTALPYRNPWWRWAAGTDPAAPCCCCRLQGTRN